MFLFCNQAKKEKEERRTLDANFIMHTKMREGRKKILRKIAKALLTLTQP